MEYIDGKPVLDYEDCINYILNSTGITRDIVEKVIDSETEYLSLIHISEPTRP